MKVTIDIDCTPQEARTFLGLPDIKPIQDAMMGELEAKMRASLNSLDPESFIKTWMPMGAEGFEQIQKMFWGQLKGGEK